MLAAGLLLPLPAFVAASPMARLLLACVLGATFVRAVDLGRAWAAGGCGARLARLCAYFDPDGVKRGPRRFDVAALATLAVATAVFAAAVASVKGLPDNAVWLPVRWLAGGAAVLALAEMAGTCHDFVTSLLGLTVPPMFRSPYRSTTVSEFWTRRWNLPASAALREHCFAQLARRGVVLALAAAFAVSAAGHALLAGLTLGDRWLASVCAAFFLAQPLVLAAERRLGVRRWPTAAGWLWTCAVLAITSPLVVEPLLRIVEPHWGPPDDVLGPTTAAIGFCAALAAVAAAAALPFRPPVAGQTSLVT
jgi:hypothetical protein